MTLSQRLLLATFLLTAAATASFGYGVRAAFQRAEERRFSSEFQSALVPLRQELSRLFRELPLLVTPVCLHDSLVDGALVGLTSEDTSWRLRSRLRVPELARALDVDELWLVTQHGEVLGAHDPGLTGKRDPSLAARVRSIGGQARLSRAATGPTMEAACRQPPGEESAGKRSGPGERNWVGLLAVRRVGPVLDRVGKAYGINLSLESTPADPSFMSQRIRLAELGSMEILASRSRIALAEALAALDLTVLGIGGGTVLGALLAAGLLSRGLAQPMVDLARQASDVMRGELRPIVATGPTEIVESARAFNRAIEDLGVLRKRLAASERIAAWREIARGVAHEIKNPLLPIRAAIETLRRLRARQDPAFDDYFDEATRTALDEVNRINRIVSEFTEFARLPPPNPSQVDLSELLRQVLALHGSVGPKLELTSSASPHVLADRDQVVQVVTNLLQNALDAVSGREDPRISIALEPRGADHVRVSIRDNGSGIAPEIRARLFMPYATTKASGTGLGLAIAHRLVTEHGGEIGVHSGEDGVTEFWFDLPVRGPPTLSSRPVRA